MRVILHSDLNNFYASCECSRDLSLKEKPVAVCGSQAERHGIVLAKNYLAKSYGIKTGDTVWMAKQKCPELVTVEPHFSLYVKYSELVRNIYKDYTNRVEGFGMDECWLDISGENVTMADGERIANEIRERVKFETGLTVSVGVSFNKIFAKLGSDMKKPDAVTVISEENFKEKIYGLPAGDLLGVGRATKKKFDRYGILTIGDIAHTDKEFFTNLIGVNGLLLWNFANGLDTSEVSFADSKSVAKSFGHGTTTMYDLTENDEVWRLFLSLAQDIGKSLIESDMKCSGVSVCVRNSELFTVGFQCKLSVPTSCAYDIAAAAFELFKANYNWRLPIRSATISAINLVDGDESFGYDLFKENERKDKRNTISLCVNNIRNRYGENSVMPATLLEREKLAPDKEIKLKMPKGINTSR